MSGASSKSLFSKPSFLKASGKVPSLQSIAAREAPAKKIDYILYHNEQDVQSISVAQFLRKTLDSTQLTIITTEPTAADLRKVAYMMNVDDQKHLSKLGILSEDDLKRTMKGDNELIAQRMIEKGFGKQIRPMLLSPLNGECVIQGNVDKVTALIHSPHDMAW